MKRTLQELLALLKSDPGALTPSEIRFVRGEVKRLQGGASAKRKPEGAGSERDGYEKIKREAAARRRGISRAGRDIGELPPVADAERKARGLASLRVFCETYFAQKRFTLAWSPTHLAVIETLERVILNGGREVKAVERGFGKTSLLEVAAIWGIVRGLHPFVQLIGSTRLAALEMLDSIRGELEENELFAADFPEVCYPIQCLDGIANRAAGQLYQGRRTKIGITKEELTLPTIDGSPASGAIIRITGLLGRVRGRKKRSVRPSLVLIDDPQTDDSAISLAQTDKREGIICGAVAGLAGPDKELSVLMAGTVIERGDLVDRFLDPGKHRDWIKQKFKMLLSFPKQMSLWEQYWTIKTDSLRNGGDGAEATAFYRDRQGVMDEGAEVSWPQRVRPGRISGIQNAMDLYFENPRKFMSEMQGEPMERDLGDGQLDKEALAGQVNGLARGAVPLGATRLTAFIDVQKKALYWLVAAWGDDMTGAVIDYGTWPEQGRRWFTKAEIQKTLQRAKPGAKLQAAILHGLGCCVDELVSREWVREDKTAMRIERLLIDSGWGESTDTVHSFCRQTRHATIVMASRGRYVGVKNRPWSDYQRKEGERLGVHWLVTGAGAKHANRRMEIDTNFWKSVVADGLQTAVGDRGAIVFFGLDRVGGRSGGPADHQLLVDHLTSEYFVELEGQGRKVREWVWRPERNDNEWLDGLVGAAAAASERGGVLPGHVGVKKRGVSLAEQRRRQLARLKARQAGRAA